jgi:Na+-driven multidrug efflux pump
VILYLGGELWLGLIVGMGETLAIEYGMQRLFYVCLFTFINAINNVLSHALQAFGYPLFTSITNIAFHLGFRVFWMQFIYPMRPEFSTVMQCFTASWTLNMIFYAIFVAVIYVRYVKYGKCKRI